MEWWKIGVVGLLMLSFGALQQPLPEGYWPVERSQEILDKTLRLRLAPDLSVLSPAERGAVEDLLQVGAIFQELYEEALHRQARGALRALQTLHKRSNGSRATANLLDLYRIFEGPIATTLDNRREGFLPVDPEVPGKNVYPWGVTAEEVEAFLARHPERRAEILGERTVVRRAVAENVRRDLAALQRHPVLATLHPETVRLLRKLSEDPDQNEFYAVPYSLAYAGRVMEAYALLRRAAGLLEEADPELARYLHNRARDLLSNDYESGDASWVTGRFQRLNAQIGAYETYDDSLFGAKAFWSLSLLLRNEEATRELEKGLTGLQEIENALPYEHQKRIREDIPVGVYEVIADFGQARGTNTATILPNDPLFSRRYGRTILLRENIMTHPELFALTQRAWKAVVAKPFEDDLVPEGNFQRTLWHEIGHYLGVDRDREARALDLALGSYADALEEMKADLASLFAMHRLAESGAASPERLRAVQAAGIRRTLQNNQPRKDQPYQTMQLSQFNYFLKQGLLEFDEERKALVIHYDGYQPTVASLLREVLDLQYQGDKEKAARFFEAWTTWDPELHGELAARMRAAQGPRYRLVRYAALNE